MITINGFEVKVFFENGSRYVSCNGKRYPVYHIAHYIKLVFSLEKLYEVDRSKLILKDRMFGMEIKFEDLLRIYKEIYDI